MAQRDSPSQDPVVREMFDTLYGPSGGTQAPVGPGFFAANPATTLGVKAKLGTPNLVFDGDSMTVIGVEGQALSAAGFGNGYPTQTIQSMDPSATLANVAVAGQTVLTMTTNAPTNVDPKYDATKNSVVLLLGGTNDLGQTPFQTATTTYNRIVAYHQARRAAGWRTVVFTIMPRTSAGTPGTFDTDRQTVNTNIRANWTTFADALADVGGDAVMGNVANTTDTRYFTDQLHPTPLGSRIIAGYAKSALATLGILAGRRSQIEPLFSNFVGLHCLGLGFQALSANTTGIENTAIGEASLAANLTSNSSTAVGYNALNVATAGNNTAVGWGALQNDTTGTQNAALGVGALRGNVGGSQNTAVGYAALNNAAAQSNNTAIGYNAMSAAATGGGSTAIGSNALAAYTGNSANTAIGSNALLASTTGANNVAVGTDCLQANLVGNANTGFGRGSLYNSTGSNNTAIGWQTLVGLTSGNDCVAVGNQAGYTLTPANATTTGLRQTLVGEYAGQNTATQLNDIVALGYAALVGGNNGIAIGSGATTTQPGAVAIGKDSAGTSATSTLQDAIVLGTALSLLQLRNNATGAGSAALGANCPAVTVTAPYTWVRMLSNDGSTIFVPGWK